MVEGLLAAAGGLHGDAQHLLELALTDVVVQASGPESVLPDHRLLLGSGGGIHQPLDRRTG